MNKKSNIIVTGGMGFIGFEIAQSYSALGHQVFVIDNCSNLKIKKTPSNFKFISCDLRNKKDVFSIIESVKPEIISHQAAHIDVNNSIANPIFDAENNILSTLNILESIKDHKVKKFIFSSSGGAVYSLSGKEPFIEKTVLAPTNPYGIAKMACEKYITFFAKEHSFQSIILRYSNVYGLGQIHNKYQGVIIKFLKKILENKTVQISGDGSQSRDFVYIDDVVQANMLALGFSGDSDVFNIGSDKKSSINEIVSIISQALKKNPQIKLKNGNPGVASSLLDITKARKKLKYSPKFSIQTGIEDLINKLVTQPSFNPNTQT